jgi:hypothetical protein
VEVIVSPEAREYVREHGGVVYVRAHSHTCCSGSLTLLDVWTKKPNKVAHFVPTTTDGIEVQFCGGSGSQPHQLSIEMRGLLRQKLVAYWDGCVFKI